MAKSVNSITDEDGSNEDWIEIFNAGTNTVDLAGWYLTDSASKPTKWTFPSTNLAPGQFLLVWASNKDRSKAGAPLHTNFKLDPSLPEYLALIRPDLTIASSFAPTYPVQVQDISYGRPLVGVTNILAGQGSAVRYWVPLDAFADPYWFQQTFDDSAWSSGLLGVGYNSVTNTNMVWVPLADSMRDYSGAQGSNNWHYGYATGGLSGYQAVGFIPFPAFDAKWGTNNYWNPATRLWDNYLTGPYDFIGNNTWHPNGTNTTGGQHWVIRRYQVKTGGNLRLDWWLAKQNIAGGNGVSGYIFVNGVQQDTAAINGLDGVGVTRSLLVSNVNMGDTIDFALSPQGPDNALGDANDGSYGRLWIYNGYSTTNLIITDVTEAVAGGNGSLYTRIPFTVGNPADLNWLQLRVKFNDGFVAYLNGQEVARRNAPQWFAGGLVADNALDWSGVGQQGQNNWYYGYYDYTLDANGLYDPTVDFNFTDDTWAFTGTNWVLGPDDPPYTMMASNLWKPNGTNNLNIQWPVRRWISPVSGVVTAAVSIAKAVVGGNGVTLHVFHNGNELFNQAVGGNDTLGFSTNWNISDLRVGDYLEFALDPKGPDGIPNDTNDLTTFAVTISQGPSGDPAWNSTAAVHCSPLQNGAGELIDITAYKGFLMAGSNVLAVHAMNFAPDDPDFLVMPEVLGITSVVDTNQGVYFSTPTPLGVNGAGSTNLGPVIAGMKFTPAAPTTIDPIVVSANAVTTLRPIASLSLTYRVMYSNEITMVMNDVGTNGDVAAGDGVYTATIPGSIAGPGQMVRWYITSYDNLGVSMRSPAYVDPVASPQYYGTVINDPSVVSQLPVLYWYIQDLTAANNEIGSRSSFYFNGQFVDNVGNTVHGQSSGGFPKHSYNFNLNRGNKLEWTNNAPAIGDFALITTWADRSYMRNMLTSDTYNWCGVPAHFVFAVRVQTNGGFFSVANVVEQGNEDYLQRIGLDQNGALYKIYNTLNTPASNEKKTRDWEPFFDLQALINGVTQSDASNRVSYIYDNINLPRTISFLASKAINSDHDCCHKNHYMYRDSNISEEWFPLPWDMDLSFGHVFGNGGYFDDTITTNLQPYIGGGQTMLSVIYNDPTLKAMVARRIRSLMEEWLQAPGTPPEQDILRAQIDHYEGLVRSDAILDRAKWGSATWAAATSGPANTSTNIYNLTNETYRLKDYYLPGRRSWLFVNCATNSYLIPGAETEAPNALLRFGAVDYNPASGDQAQEYIELINHNNFAVDISKWQLDGAVQFQFLQGTVIPANSRIYVSPDVKAFRNRTSSPKAGERRYVVGPCSGQLSARGENLVLRTPKGQTNASLSFPGNPSLAQQFLRITEIMYNPPTGGVYAAGEYEYLELKNISTNTPINLSGVKFTEGVSFNFNGAAMTNLLAGQTVVLVKNPTAFASRYGEGFPVIGIYTGALDNAGERLRLLDEANEEILDFTYDNKWYPLTDGLGFSLVVVDEQAESGKWGNQTQWRASGRLRGSPATNDPAPLVFTPVVINECLAHTDPPQMDTIELYNPSAIDVNLGGWYLTDDFFAPKKFRIPDGTIIQSNGFLVYYDTNFNSGLNAFLFSSTGDSVYLFSADTASDLTGYYHGFDFGASENGVGFGRYLNSQGEEHFVFQSDPSYNTNNVGPRVGPIVISEIMYHPAALTTNDPPASYIELMNITETNVPLYTFTEPTNTWRIRNAVDFDFPTNVILSAGQVLLVVGFDPVLDTNSASAFRTRYNLDISVPLFGPWQGQLANDEETIELKKPDFANSNDVPYVMMEKVRYHDAAPWPSRADGQGAALQRLTVSAFANDPTNWAAAWPSPGTAVPSGTPAQIVSQPNGGSVSMGSNYTFSVTVSGDAPLFRQWSFNGVNLVGETNASLNLSNILYAQAGQYQLTVYNYRGIAASTPVTLLVVPGQVTLKTDDTVGTSSWNGNTNWSDNTIPSINNDYLVTGLTLRSPLDVGNPVAFGGHALTLQGGQFLVRHVGNFTNDILRLNGATLWLGGSTSETPVTNYGNIYLNPGESVCFGTELAGRSIEIKANIMGTGTAPLVLQNIQGGITLSGANQYTNALMLTNATFLRVGHPQALGATNGGTIIARGATLDINGQNLDLEPVTVEGEGAGGIGAITAQAGWQPNALRMVTLSGDTYLGAAAACRWDLRGHPTGKLTGNGFALSKVGPGQVWLAGGGDTDLGDISVLAGVLVIEGDTSLGRTSSVVNVSAGAVLEFSESTLIHAKPMVIKGGTLRKNRGNTTLTGAVTLNATGDFQSYNSDGMDLVLAGNISGPYGIIISGGGRVVLAASNTFTGDIFVQSGRLGVTSQDALVNAKKLTLNTNTVLDISSLLALNIRSNQALHGFGTINGNLADTNGATITPGVVGGAGTLTVTGALFLNGGGLVNFDLGSQTNETGLTNDLINVGGSLVLNGITQIQINPTTAVLNTNPYTLFNYQGVLLGVTSNLQLVMPASNSRYTYALDTNLPGKIRLLASAVTPLTNVLVWQGTGWLNDWDLVSSNWLYSGVTQTFNQHDSVVFDDTAPFKGVDVPTTIWPQSIMVNATQAYTFSGSGRVSGSTGLTKTNSGTLMLRTTNDFTGPVMVQGGVLRLGSSSALGSCASITVVSNAQLDFAGFSQSSKYYTYSVAGSGSDGQGGMINSGNSVGTGSGISNLVLTANATIGTWGSDASGGRIDLGNTYGLLTGNGYKLTKVGPGWLDVRCRTTNLTELIINGGLVFTEGVHSNLGSKVTVNAGGMLGAYGANTQVVQVVLDGGTLVGAGGNINFWNGGLVINSASYVSNYLVSGTGPSHLRVSGVISGSGALIKTGTNTLIVSGSNTYTNQTLIQGGKLNVMATNSLRTSAKVVISAGASLETTNLASLGVATNQSLAGWGSVLANLVVSNGATVYPGDDSTVGTLTVASNLTLNGGARLVFDLGSLTNQGGVNNDLLIVNSNLSMNGVTTIKINPVGTSLSNSYYNLIAYGGVLTGNVANLVVTTDVRSVTATLDFTVTNRIRVLITGGLYTNLVWAGDVAGKAMQANWDITATNWDRGGSNMIAFKPGDRVGFSSSPIGRSMLVNLVGGLPVGGIVFSNGAGSNYTLVGSGYLAGGAALVKSGAGTLTFANSGIHSYQGPTIISNGIFQVGTNSANGTLPGTPITNYGTLIFNRSNDYVVTNMVLGTGGVYKVGTSTLTLGGNSASFTGPIYVDGGVLKLAHTSALGHTNGFTWVTNGAVSLDLAGMVNVNDSINLAGNGFTNGGALLSSVDGAGANNLSGATVNLFGHTTLAMWLAGRRWDMSAGAFKGNGFNLTKTGPGQVTLKGTIGETSVSNLYLMNGELRLENDTRTGLTNGMICIASNATLGFYNLGITNINLKPVYVTNGTWYNGSGTQTNRGITTIYDRLTYNLGNGVFMVQEAPVIGSGMLQKEGAGSILLTNQANSYAGGMLVNGGAVFLPDLGSLPSLAITNNSQLVLNVTNGQTLSFTLPVQGIGQVRNHVNAQGSVVIPGPLTNYVGGGGGITLVDSGARVVGGFDISTGTVYVASGASIIASNIIVGDNKVGLGNVNVTYSGYTASYSNYARLVFTNGADLVFNQNNGNFMVGTRGQTVVNSWSHGTFDASRMSDFRATVANIRVGYGTVNAAGSANGLLLLATNNSLVAGGQFVVGYNDPSVDNALVSEVIFGSGSNYVRTPSFTIGYLKTGGRGILPAGGVLRLDNGNTRATVYVGRNEVGTGSSPTSIFDLSGGTFIGSLSDVYVARKTLDANGGCVASWILGDQPHQVDMNNLYVGHLNLTGANIGSTVNGTVTLSNGVFHVRTNVQLAWLTGTVGATNANLTGTLNLYGGYFGVAGDMLGSAPYTNTVLLDGGSLDLRPAFDSDQAGNLGTAAKPVNNLILRSGTLKNVGGYNGGVGAVVKTGAGTLLLEGTNSWSNLTVVSNGTLQIRGVLGMSFNSLDVKNGATLRGTGNIKRHVNIDGGAHLYPGPGLGVFAVDGNVNLATGAELLMKLDRAALTNSDRLILAGVLNAFGNLIVTNIGSALQPGDRFRLVAGPIAGAFASVTLPVLTADYSWDTNNLYNAGEIVVNHAPVFLADPVSQTNLASLGITLNGLADGFPAPVYQWYSASGLVSGEFATNLSLSVAQTNAYYLVASNVSGVATSAVAWAVLTNRPVPVGVSLSPLATNAVIGSAVTFAATVGAGAEPLSYRWYFNNQLQPVTAATNTFTVTSVGCLSTGAYQVVVSNAFGVATSAVASLTVTNPGLPVLVSQMPTNPAVTILRGSNVTLNIVVAESCTVQGYQWRFNTNQHAGGIVSSGDTNGFLTVTLTLTNAQVTQAGDYTVWLTNANGVTSVSWQVQVVYPAVITSQPTNAIVTLSNSVSLTASVDGTEPLSCQWWRQGNKLVGATNTSLVVTASQCESGGSYWLVASNGYGIATSEVASVTVQDTNLPIVLNATSNLITVSGANIEMNVALGYACLGPSYAWYFNNTNFLASSSNSLVLANVQTNSSGDYCVVVSNANGAVTSLVMSLTVTNQWSAPGLISVTPTNATVALGRDATFTATTSVGTEPLTYLWYANKLLVASGTNLLVVSNVNCATATAYQVVVTNLYGSSTSVVVSLMPTSSLPALISIPTNHLVDLGSNITLVATLTNACTVSGYEWFFQTTNRLTQSISSNAPDQRLFVSLPIINAGLSNMGLYTLWVTNNAGSTSATVFLQVNYQAEVLAANVLLGSNTLGLIVRAESGRAYWLEMKTNLTDLEWRFVFGVTNTNGPILLQDVLATNSYRFYRIGTTNL